MSDITHQLLLFGAVLFTMGMVSFLTRRSMILMFLSLEMMLAGVSVNLIAFSKQHQNYQGQVMAIMVLTVAACEAAIALAMVVSLNRRKATLDVNEWSELSEMPNVTSVERPISIVEEPMEYPKLIPAGLDPRDNPMPSKLRDSDWKEVEKVRQASEVSQNA